MKDNQPLIQEIRSFTSEFDSAFCSLADSLTTSLCTPETTPGDRADNLRNRYIIALGSLSNFFTLIGQRDIGRTFFELAAMLEDLKRGVVHPTLKAGISNGRPDRFDLWMARDTVARAIDFLIQSGMDPSEAAAFAARSFPDLNRLKRDTGDNLTAAITSWFRRLQDGSVTNEIARETFADNTKLLEALIERMEVSSGRLKAAAEVLLERAVVQARALIIEGEVSATPTSVELGSGERPKSTPPT
jgi:hypothetical protein